MAIANDGELQEYDQDAEDKALIAAMSEDDFDDSKTSPNDEESNAQEEADVKAEDQEEDSTEEATDERVEVVPGFTAEELKKSLAEIPRLQKALDTTNGTYGKKLDEQQRVIDELRREKAEAEKKSREEELQNKPKLKRTQEEFDTLAEVLAPDIEEWINDAVSGLKSDANTQDVKKVLAEELDKRFKDVEQKAVERAREKLAKRHPDWQEIALIHTSQDGSIEFANKEFGNWISTQPDEVQKEIIESDDPYEISEWLTKYKESKSTDNLQSRKAKLNKAIQPRGVQGTKRALSDDEAEEEAFRKAMAEDDF